MPGGGAAERGWLPEHLPTWAFPELEVRAGLEGPVGLGWKPAVCERNRLGSGGRAGHSSSHGSFLGEGAGGMTTSGKLSSWAGAACRRWECCACFFYLWAQPGRGVPGDSLSWPSRHIKPFLHLTGLLPSPRGCGVLPVAHQHSQESQPSASSFWISLPMSIAARGRPLGQGKRSGL